MTPEHLAIAPTVDPTSAPTLAFDWEPVTLGSCRSYLCTVTSDGDDPLTGEVEQGLYRRAFSGTQAMHIPAIPPTAAGTEGTLVVRNTATGATATCRWRWEPREPAGAVRPATQARPGLLGRLFGRGKDASAGARTQSPAAKGAPIAARLGTRAALAVSLTFFGQETLGQRVAFILDRSGSMHGKRWSACTRELERALRALPPQIEFMVLMFSSTTIEPPIQPNTGWIRAERHTIDRVLGWVGSLRPFGGTYPTDAFRRAFMLAEPPDVIYFLTDGELAHFGLPTFVEFRADTGTIVNTIALESDASVETLRSMAELSGGRYTHITSASPGGS